MDNKRGQGLSTSTIILVILGIFVLIILIVGFMSGWESFKILQPKNNVKAVSSNCQTACTTEDEYSYCSVNRTLILEKGQRIYGNCSYFSNTKILNGKFKYLGIQDCSNLCS